MAAKWQSLTTNQTSTSFSTLLETARAGTQGQSRLGLRNRHWGLGVVDLYSDCSQPVSGGLWSNVQKRSSDTQPSVATAPPYPTVQTPV